MEYSMVRTGRRTSVVVEYSMVRTGPWKEDICCCGGLYGADWPLEGGHLLLWSTLWCGLAPGRRTSVVVEDSMVQTGLWKEDICCCGVLYGADWPLVGGHLLLWRTLWCRLASGRRTSVVVEYSMVRTGPWKEDICCCGVLYGADWPLEGGHLLLWSTLWCRLEGGHLLLWSTLWCGLAPGRRTSVVEYSMVRTGRRTSVVVEYSMVRTGPWKEDICCCGGLYGADWPLEGGHLLLWSTLWCGLAPGRRTSVVVEDSMVQTGLWKEDICCCGVLYGADWPLEGGHLLLWSTLWCGLAPGRRTSVVVEYSMVRTGPWKEDICCCGVLYGADWKEDICCCGVLYGADWPLEGGHLLLWSTLWCRLAPGRRTSVVVEYSMVRTGP